jgi:hypothetical protein
MTKQPSPLETTLSSEKPTLEARISAAIGNGQSIGSEALYELIRDTRHRRAASRLGIASICLKRTLQLTRRGHNGAAFGIERGQFSRRGR